MIADARLRSCLAAEWGLPRARIVPHHGGMNSATWFVSRGGARWVAKAVSRADREAFAAGLAVATALEMTAGIPAGAPMPTRAGHRTVAVDGCGLALLALVPGEGLTADPAHQRLIGTTLARAHHALQQSATSTVGSGSPEPRKGQAIRPVVPFHWVDPGAAHLAVRQWVRPAVGAAVAALDRLDPRSLTQGMLHADPAPAAFRWDSDRGVCGLIDWATAIRGPLLYDMASAVMYIGGPDRARPLVDAYLEQAAMPLREVVRGLPVMLRFRWAVQADYFARRIVTRDLTGIEGDADNEAGIADAYVHLSQRQ